MSIAAIILAGGKTSPPMRQATGGVENRALVPLAGRRMLDYVLDAVRAGLSGQGRVLVAGDVPLPTGCDPVPGGVSLVDTLMNGVAALTPEETQLLAVTADIPFLTAEAVQDFLTRAADREAEFHYPVVRADLCATRFPGMRRTTLRLAEGVFTGGNLALLSPAFLREHEATVHAAYARRKSVVGLAQMLGPGLLARLVLSRIAPRLLTIPVLETAVSRLLGGAQAHAIVSPFPEVAADVDHPEDLPLAARWLSEKA